MSNGRTERRDAIVDFVQRKGEVNLRQLKEAFPDVSEITIRTDLRDLDEEGRLVRIYGGARSVENVVGTDDYLNVKVKRNANAKIVIAEKAVNLVQPNTSIYLDGGSTCRYLAGMLPNIDLLVFTNSIAVVNELMPISKIQVEVLGGMINRYGQCLDGSRAILTAQQIRFDQVFLGVAGYSEADGFSCESNEWAVFKQVCLNRANQKIVLMDSSKVEQSGIFTICDLQGVDIVVGEGGFPSSFVESCEEAGVQVL